MNDIPTPEQIAKLPQWAQKYISNLQHEAKRDRELAKNITDTQTPSPVYVPDYSLCPGPEIQRFVSMEHASEVVFDHAKIHLRVRLCTEDDSQRDFGIELKWGKNIDLRSKVGLYPRGYNTIMLINPKNLR